MDSLSRTLRRREEVVTLNRRAFDVLVYLVQNPGRVLSRDELLKMVWPDTFVDENSLAQSISSLRRALDERPGDNSYIITLPGRGYQFVSQVKVVASEALTIPDAASISSEPKSGVLLQRETMRTSITTQERDLRELQSAESRVRVLRARAAVVLALIATALVVWAVVRPVPTLKVLRAVRLTQSGTIEPSGRVLTDGLRLYFTERIGGKSRLAEIPDRGGDLRPILSSLDNIALYDIDPTKTLLLVGSQAPSGDYDDPLWVLPTSVGSPRRIADALASDGAWSPDGHALVYGRKNQLFIADSEGQNARELFSASGNVFSPHWSPDGRLISFSVRGRETGTVSLWEVGRDGHNAHRLSFGWNSPRNVWNEGECCGEWSPDGKDFVFRSVRDNVQSLWMIASRTRWFQKRAAPVEIYTSPDHIGEPTFSRDGRKILFIDYQEHRELMRYDLKRKLFVPYLAGIPARHLSFSHNGQWVAYENASDKTLWRSRLDGSTAQQLTFPPLEVLQSTWSRDDQQIVFAGNSNLYVIPSLGGTAALLARGIEPSWSPDGRSILFVANAANAGWHPRIYEMEWSTHNVSEVPGSDDMEGPQWSPDGRFAAAADRSKQELALFDFNRHEWSTLAKGLPYGWGIRWSADSKDVYYQDHIGEQQPIFRVGVSNHAVEQITSVSDMLRADVLSYTMTGLTSDGSPLVSLVRRNSDVYALELEVN